MSDHQPAAARTVVCNAGPLIHLDQLGCLDLLSDFAPVLVPEAVWEEVAHHRSGALSAAFLERTLPPARLEPAVEVVCAAFALDAGESECLAVLAAVKAGLFLTDDAAARLAAEQLGLRIRGTIGFLTRAIRVGKRSADDVIKVLERLPETSTLFLRQELLDRVIAEVRAWIEKERN